KEWPGERSLAALVLHNRFGMTDEVAYLDQVWNPATQQIAARPRLERNHDQTNTWGAHVEYVRPLAATGWRIGWLATANLMSHGKAAALQLGLMVRSVHYHLAQSDNVQAVAHALQEAWVEWTPTWGVSLRFPDLEIRYRGRVTKGTGRPGVAAPSGFFAAGRD